VLQLHHQHQQLMQQQQRRRCRSIHCSSRCLVLLVGCLLCMVSGRTRHRSSSCLVHLVQLPMLLLAAAAVGLTSMPSLKGHMLELAPLVQQQLGLAACLVAA
jgi:hypothetical protein